MTQQRAQHIASIPQCESLPVTRAWSTCTLGNEVVEEYLGGDKGEPNTGNQTFAHNSRSF